MATTLNKIVETLAERTGRAYDIAFKKELKVIVNYWRVKIIVDSLNSRPKDRVFFQQWFDMPLISVPISDFEGFPTDCTVMRTKCKLPKPLRANSIPFDYIGMLNKMTPIALKPLYTIENLLDGKYSGREIYASLINDYIYIINGHMPGIAVCMIPQSLEELSSCCSECGSKECYTDDSPFPATDDIVTRIVQAILATELSGGNTREDTKEVINDEANKQGQ